MDKKVTIIVVNFFQKIIIKRLGDECLNVDLKLFLELVGFFHRFVFDFPAKELNFYYK